MKPSLLIDLAAISKSVGLSKSDLPGFHKLLESLAVSDDKKPEDKRRGYAAVLSEYKDSGLEFLHKAVMELETDMARHSNFPDTPSIRTNPDKRDMTCHSFLVEFNTNVDVLRVINYASKWLRNLHEEHHIEIQEGVGISTSVLDLLVASTANPVSLATSLAKIADVKSVKFREKYDYGSKSLDVDELQSWDKETLPVPLTTRKLSNAC